MTATVPAFAGRVPETYHEYLVPLIFEEYARDLANRVLVPDTGQVLETACGTGVVTGHLRAALRPSVRIIATDFTEHMLDVAQDTIGGLHGLEYEVADGTALRFPDDSFDAVVCQFGVMFFPDKSLGYREAARVLKPGGSFVFSVWDSLAHNDFAACVHEHVTAMSPDDDFLGIPYAYHDVSEIKTELQAVGFRRIDVSVLPSVSRARSARDVALALVAGTPLASALTQRQVLKATVDSVEAALVREYGRGSVSAPMQSIAITAVLPEGSVGTESGISPGAVT